jgi:hypothetical protein
MKLDAEFKQWTRLVWEGELSMENYGRLQMLENMYKHYELKNIEQFKTIINELKSKQKYSIEEPSNEFCNT